MHAYLRSPYQIEVETPLRDDLVELVVLSSVTYFSEYLSLLASSEIVLSLERRQSLLMDLLWNRKCDNVKVPMEPKWHFCDSVSKGKSLLITPLSLLSIEISVRFTVFRQFRHKPKTFSNAYISTWPETYQDEAVLG